MRTESPFYRYFQDIAKILKYMYEVKRYKYFETGYWSLLFVYNFRTSYASTYMYKSILQFCAYPKI
jgi:hypothetical protein